MRNPLISEESNRNADFYSDPDAQCVGKALCNRCQQYLDEGLKLTEHLQTCLPLHITKKDKVFNSTKENSDNPTSYPPPLKQQPKARIAGYQPVVKDGSRRAVRELMNNCKKKRQKQKRTEEESLNLNIEEEMMKGYRTSDRAIVYSEMEEDKSVSIPTAIISTRVDSFDSPKEYSTPTPIKTSNNMNNDVSLSFYGDETEYRENPSWRNSQILFASSQQPDKYFDPVFIEPTITGYSISRDLPQISSSSNHSSNNLLNPNPAALYKKKLSEAHDAKRDISTDDDNESINSSKVNKEPTRINTRKKTKKNHLAIPSETMFKPKVITEEDKSKPICARTRSSKVKEVLLKPIAEIKSLRNMPTSKEKSSDTHLEVNARSIDTIPAEIEIEGTTASLTDVQVEKSVILRAVVEAEDSSNIPVECEDIALLTRSKRKTNSIKRLAEEQEDELKKRKHFKLRKMSIRNKIKENPKETIKKKDNKKNDKKKNIPRKKPSNIIIPSKKTTIKYAALPSPIHTITRSRGSKSDFQPDKSQLQSKEPEKESIIEKNLSTVSKQINHEDLVVLDTVLGEGQVGTVNLAKYKGLLVACKSKRLNTRLEPFNYQIQRELKYAADLSVCRYINRYIGWTYCPRFKVEHGITDARVPKLYVIQKYIPNGDARSYLDGRESTFHPFEAIQAAICLFSALTDAHSLGIGIVDLKLENFLIDSSGTGWLTDFGSCIEFYNKDQVDLDDEEVAWTTNVAAPEMIKSHHFSKASDVFMAALIVAELLTVELSDEQFYTQVLKRHKSNGSVKFSSSLLHRRYSAFFPLLEVGLANDPKDRPCAKDMLSNFISLRDKII